MSTYRAYAAIYDRIGQAAFSEQLIRQILAALPAPPRRALDLACGTGAAALLLAAAGAHVVGVDRSPQMLAIAQARARDAGLRLRVLQADLRRLPIRSHRRAGQLRAAAARALPSGAFDLVTCLYDSLNYLTEPGDLATVCASAARLLRPGGRFVFDMNTVYEFASWDDTDQVVFDSPDVLVYNRLSYDSGQRMARGRIVWFVRELDRWWRDEETHVERAWGDDEVLAALEAAGLLLLSRRTPAWGVAAAAAPRVVYEVLRPPLRGYG